MEFFIVPLMSENRGNLLNFLTRINFPSVSAPDEGINKAFSVLRLNVINFYCFAATLTCLVFWF